MSTPLTPPTEIPPELGPLRESYEADAVEAELKAAFMEVFEAMLRAAERRLNTYGMPHRGSFHVVERFTKAAGLTMERSANREVFMAELFRAWIARNPRRGTQFLQHYLQLLWPGQWTLSQLWHDPVVTYPNGLGPEAPGRYLTSRLQLNLEIDDLSELDKLVGSFRAVLPVKFVLGVALQSGFGGDLRLAGVFMGSEFQDFAGTAAPATPTPTPAPTPPPGPAERLITFEGIPDNTGVGGFYNGGAGGSWGISFSSNARASVDSDSGGTGSFGNEPSPDTAMRMASGTSVVIDVPSGFEGGLALWFSTVSATGTVKVYDAIGATGSELIPVIGTGFMRALGVNADGDPTGDFVKWESLFIAFEGIAKSIKITGTVDQFLIDNMTLAVN